jgi:hypothetical protein
MGQEKIKGGYLWLAAEWTRCSTAIMAPPSLSCLPSNGGKRGEKYQRPVWGSNGAKE